MTDNDDPSPISQNLDSGSPTKSHSQRLRLWIGGGLLALLPAVAALLSALLGSDGLPGLITAGSGLIDKLSLSPVPKPWFYSDPVDLRKIFPTPSSVDIEPLSIDGSTSMVQMIRDIQKEVKNSKDIDVYYGENNLNPRGSIKAIDLLKKRFIHIAAISNELLEEDKRQGLIAIPIAKDGIAVIVHKDNPVKNLTIAQLKKIYTCRVTDWGVVGGDENVGIRVINRYNSSGTREAFKSLVLPNEDFCLDTKSKSKNGSSFKTWPKDETTQVLKNLETNGIYYTSTQQVSFNNYKSLAINEREPTFINIYEDTYPLVRDLYLVARKDTYSDVVSFIDFMQSSKGQEIVGRYHLPIYKTKMPDLK